MRTVFVSERMRPAMKQARAVIRGQPKPLHGTMGHASSLEQHIQFKETKLTPENLLFFGFAAATSICAIAASHSSRPVRSISLAPEYHGKSVDVFLPRPGRQR